MRKIITILIVSAALFAACEKKEGDFTIDPNGTIIAYKGTAEDLVIPAQINDVQVTAIWSEVFSHKGLSSVTIPDSVVYIGRNAFSGNQLSSVIIPEGVTVISDFVFDKNQLNYVTIPSSVISIGNNAFSGNKLSSVIIPDGVTSIGDSAFYGNHLTSVIIPDGVTSIGNSAFYGNQLTSITIPDGVTSIGDSAFASNQLSFVTIPDSVTRIGDSAFARNILTSVTIPDGVTSIGNNAFARNDLISVIIPNNVTSIGEKAFDSNKLTSVTIFANLASLRYNVFDNNPLTTVTIGDGVSLGNDVYISGLTSVVLGKDARFGAGVFGYTAYYEYLYNGRKAGTYTVIRNNSEVDEDFEFIKTRYGAVIYGYRGEEQNLQAIPRQLGGMTVIGIGGTFARKNAHRLQLPNGVTFLDKEAYENMTTRKLTGKAIYFNKLIENDDSVNYAMGEESNNYKLGLIGWTNTGLVAYFKYDMGYMWINGIRLIIYDTVKNRTIESIQKKLSADDENYYEPILPPEEEIRTTLKTWNDALAKHDFTERINKFNIRFDTVKPSPFPYVQGGSSWNCHFEAVVEEPKDEQPWNEPAIVKWNLLASNGPQTKIVASGAEESKGGSGMGGAYAGSNVIGYYKSPFEDRLLVAIAHYTAEFEGEIHRWVHLYGVHQSF